MRGGLAAAALLVALALAGCAHGGYVGPYKMTFASSDPVNAQLFAEKYLGGVYTKQPHMGGDGQCAMVKWVVFPNTSTGGWSGEYQMHWVKGYHRPNGTMTIDEFEDAMFALHGNLSVAAYDQFMDFHPTLTTPDLDPLAGRLLQDDVPFLVRRLPMRSGGGPAEISLFLELPHAIIVEVVGQKLTVATSADEDWDPCGTPRRAVASRLHSPSGRLPPLPSLQPLRTTYASTNPRAAANFVARYFGGAVDLPESVPAGNGTCWTVHTVTFRKDAASPPYEMRWVHRPAKPDGPASLNLTLAKYERYLKRLHVMGNNGTGDTYDEWDDFHIGLNFDDGDPITRALWADKTPFFTRGQYGRFVDYFIEGPEGQIYEVLATKQSLLTADEIPAWNLCGPTR